ncbi:TPA: peptidylprolyl isomerase, partial [Legionella pneumophila]
MNKIICLLSNLLLAVGIMSAHAETAIIKTSEGNITCELFTK